MSAKRWCYTAPDTKGFDTTFCLTESEILGECYTRWETQMRDADPKAELSPEACIAAWVEYYEAYRE